MEDATPGHDHGINRKRGLLIECDTSCRCRGTGWGSVGSVAPHPRVVAMASEELRFRSTAGYMLRCTLGRGFPGKCGYA